MSQVFGLCHDSALLTLAYPTTDAGAVSASRVIAAAALMDLTLQKRIAPVDDAFIVKDHRACPGSGLEVARSLVADGEPAAVRAFLDSHAGTVTAAVQEELAAQKLLLPKGSRAPNTEGGGDEPSPRRFKVASQAEREALVAVKNVVMGTEDPQPEVAALTCLLAAGGVLPKMLPFMGKPVISQRVTQLPGSVKWPSHALRALTLLVADLGSDTGATGT